MGNSLSDPEDLLIPFLGGYALGECIDENAFTSEALARAWVSIYSRIFVTVPL
jgi:hypothetical protein